MSDDRQPPSSVKSPDAPERPGRNRGGAPVGGRRRSELSEAQQAARQYLIRALDTAISEAQGFVVVEGALADALNDYVAARMAANRAYGGMD